MDELSAAEKIQLIDVATRAAKVALTCQSTEERGEELFEEIVSLVHNLTGRNRYGFGDFSSSLN